MYVLVVEEGKDSNLYYQNKENVLVGKHMQQLPLYFQTDNKATILLALLC